MENTISMDQVKDLLNYVIDNNVTLEGAGRRPIAVCLEAEAGIGKTSVVEEVAKERGMGFSKISLHEMEEAGDILGWPQLEYECQAARVTKDKDGTVRRTILPGTVWLNAKQLDNPDRGVQYRQTGKTHMGYAKPSWVPEYNENGTVLLLDDFTRANPQLLTAMMELIHTQRYTSWSLPKKTTIILTTNPDDGSYNVNSQDEAQSSRYVPFRVEFSEQAWQKWAEREGIDGRCINFVLSYSAALFGADDDGNRICNPRSFVMFTDMISGIKDWEDPASLAFITTIAKGCFKDAEGRFVKMFTTFIRNRMHMLIQPKQMLTGQWDKVKETMEGMLYDGDGTYRADIASILERRFASYIGTWLDTEEKASIVTVRNRLHDFMHNGRRLFTQDLMHHMVKTITSDHRNQTCKLLYDAEISQVINGKK